MMTTSEVAARLGVSDGRVRQFVSEGRLRGEREGRSLLFEEDEVERFKTQLRLPGRPARGNGAQQVVQNEPPVPQPEHEPGSSAQVRRLERENTRLRQELQQVRDLVDVLVSSSESLTRLAGVLQDVVERER